MADQLRNLKNGVPYRRRPEVEAQIDFFAALAPEELAKRAESEGPSSPDFVETETVLYFVRQKRFDHRPGALRSLYETLRLRIRSLHRSARRTAGRLTLDEAEERLLHRFNELLCLDRQGYEMALDIFECMFKLGLFSLRLNAIRDAKRQIPKLLQPLEAEDQPEPSPEVERALAKLAGRSPEDEREREYRLWLFEVINELPEDLKRVIEMHDLRGMPMDSPTGAKISVASVLGIGEQTVRNRRKRALLLIKARLQTET